MFSILIWQELWAQFIENVSKYFIYLFVDENQSNIFLLVYLIKVNFDSFDCYCVEMGYHREWSKSYPKKHADNILLDGANRPTFVQKTDNINIPSMHSLLSWEYGRTYDTKRAEFYGPLLRHENKSFIQPDIFFRTKGHFKKSPEKQKKRKKIIQASHRLRVWVVLHIAGL